MMSGNQSIVKFQTLASGLNFEQKTETQSNPEILSIAKKTKKWFTAKTILFFCAKEDHSVSSQRNQSFDDFGSALGLNPLRLKNDDLKYLKQ